jgi:hypothetical protein
MSKKSRSLSESIKKSIAAKQRYKCANKPGITLIGLGDYVCPLWKINDEDKGIFDDSGYEIDHITEFCISHNDDVKNLQALCKSCHAVKTKNFMRNKKHVKHESKNIESDVDTISDDSEDDKHSDLFLRFVKLCVVKGESSKTDYVLAVFKTWAKYAYEQKNISCGVYKHFKQITKMELIDYFFDNDYIIDSKYLYNCSIKTNFDDKQSTFLKDVVKQYLDDRTCNATSHIFAMTLYNDFRLWYVENYDKKSLPAQRSFNTGLRQYMIVKKVRIGSTDNLGVMNIKINN